jgi:hypothetical protein
MFKSHQQNEWENGWNAELSDLVGTYHPCLFILYIHYLLCNATCYVQLDIVDRRAHSILPSYA